MLIIVSFSFLLHIFISQPTDPTALPTASPTTSPVTDSPTEYRLCFPSGSAGRNELKDAVDDYVLQGCASNSACAVAQTYGYPMNSWCTRDVTSMASLFQNMLTFNEDISGWNVSSVTNMYRMFYNAAAFNSDLSSWDTSSLQGMNEMFYGATAFESDLSGKYKL